MIYDSDGNITGLTGYGDDLPLRALSPFEDGWYGAFLTKDPIEGTTNLDERNQRVRITGVGVGPGGSLELAAATVERALSPGMFPATITLLGGPIALFEGGTSNAKNYQGNDCHGATGYEPIPGLYVPVVGPIGSAAEAEAEKGVLKPLTYHSGPYTGLDTVTDISSTIHPGWLSCSGLLDLVRQIRNSADHVCSELCPCTHWASSTISTITFVDGDIEIPRGKGLLLVTGIPFLNGMNSWEGTVLAIGKGEVAYSGGGLGPHVGATLVANIAGPDRILGTADDCTGPASGFDVAAYDTSGGGHHDTIFCTHAIAMSLSGLPFQEVGFRRN